MLPRRARVMCTCSPHGDLGPEGPGPARMADPGLAYVSKVVLMSLLEKQTHSFWLLLPSALIALQD